MKNNLITIMLCLTAICAGSQTFIQVPIPGRTNQWWTNSPPQTSVVGWEAWAAQNENWTRAGTAFGSLADAHTNSALNSGVRIGYSTNSFTVPVNTTNTLPWSVTNYAGCEFTVSQGDVELWTSADNGSTWRSGGATLITNGVMKLRFQTMIRPAVFTAPVDGIVQNLKVYVLERPDLFGKTNAHYGQIMRVGTPSHSGDATPKQYVDGLFQTTMWWSARTNVQINGYAMDLSYLWRVTTGTNGGANTVRFAFLGTPALEINEPQPVAASGGSIALSGTNFQVTIPTNGLAALPKLQVSHYLVPANWTWLEASPSVVSTNYVFTFAPPFSDHAFFMAVVASDKPGAVAVKSLLQLSPRTVSAANASTYSYGAGLVCADSNYIYVSTGTNAWKRAALSAW